MRIKVSVNIDKEVYEKSHRLGVNVSQACTNYLKFLNSQIEATLGENKSFLAPDSFTKEAGVRSPGFEPGSSAWEANDPVDWEAFRSWLANKNYRGSWRHTLYSYAQKYGNCLIEGDLGKLADLSESMKPNVMKSISALAKFLGRYEDFKKQIKDFGLSWGGRSADDIIIDRLTNVKDAEEIWTWIRQVKKERSNLTEFMDLMSVSGLRMVEAVDCYNLIIRLNREGKLRKEYYNEVQGTLEHFRHKELFLRKSKKAFISFVPAPLITAISKSSALASADAISKSLRNAGVPTRFADIREAQGTFMTQFLKAPEIDFIHGRVTTSVFMANYFNPALIVDLKTRVFQGVNEILEKVKTT